MGGILDKRNIMDIAYHHQAVKGLLFKLIQPSSIVDLIRSLIIDLNGTYPF